MESKGTLRKNKGYILANGLFLIIALLNINLYTVSINMYRIILLWIFGYSIVYITSFEKDEFINILKLGCLVLVFVGILGIAELEIQKFQVMILNLSIINISTFIYLTISKIKKLRISHLLIFNSTFVIVDYLLRSIFNNFYLNMIIMAINVAMSLFNLLFVLNKTNSETEHYSLIKNLSYFALFATIIGFITTCQISIVDTDRLIGVVYLLLCNYTYYVYVYSLINRVVYPYYELNSINKKLSKKSEQLSKINLAIEKDMTIQKTLKNYIDERKELLRQALDTIPNVWIITDYDFNISYTNNAFKDEFSKDMKNFYHILNFIKEDEHVAEKLKKFDTDISIIDKQVELNNKIYLLSLSNNEEESNYLISLNNITNEIKMDKEIRAINKDYENIILNIPSPILVRSAEGGIKKNKVISINKKYEKSFKCTPKELVNMTLEKYFETFNIDFFDNREFKRLNLTKEKKAEIVSYNDTANCIINFVMSDSEGEEHVEEVRVGDYWSNNKLFKLLTFRDITKEINILRTVNEQKIIYEKLLDAIPEAIFLEDLSTSRVLYTNRAFRELFGISSDVLGVTTQKYRNILVKKYINNLNIGEREKSIHIVNENNHIKEVKMISRTLYFGQKRSRVRIIKDLSVQRESERLKKALIKQRQYDQMKMEFYANISHELKTPLNNIYSSVQLIENLYKKGKIIDCQDILREHIKITKQNMFRLLRLIDNIINISQVKSEIYKIKAVNFDIIDITERIVTSISSYAKSKGIDLVFDTNEETMRVGLDPESIERIILNILSNAIKFTLEGGEILVGIYKEGENVEILIKDTGIGIEKEKLNDIFNRFKQIENSGISNEFGSGIGLCLAKSLIEIQNGEIYIDSKLGEGTKVKIIFPIKEVVEEVYDKSNYNDNIEKFEIEFFDIYK
ncbi:PAS domain-containing sensor histidine kinase [Clostridioides sp. ES-S-0123-01]|uniref:sensor histidine kinase n=1 Tax=unclassified Clostridioides TaxID=2635829 RepID=UPI001D0CA61F|nr:PAS domain-containing sensor histidine kinase [Clostridioides sp. ES-S-0123-01]MCC0761872.1 PAS domain-containing sensor histidine kinase [Clostridioides sp. ES-S-0006-03]